MQWYAALFVTLWLWRYLRLLVHIISACTLKPIRPAQTPKYTAKDVTVVLPTFGNDNPDFRRCLRSIAACLPRAVLIVTPAPDTVQSICQDLHLHHFEVLAAPKANKRLQMIQGIEHVKTPVIVFADDDVFWPKTFLTYLLAPFEDHAVGAVGPFISLERPAKLNVWDFLGAAYLERWNFCVAATSNVDGGIACLSGRTAAVRSAILQDEAFKDHFANEKWFFNIPLSKADDDNCLTRWLVNRGWKIRIQNAPEAHATTALESNWKFVLQCVRWDRTTWRSNITSMFYDRVIWTAQPWCSYALHLSTFTPSAAILEGALAYLLYRAYDDGQPPHRFLPSTRTSAYILLVAWIIFSKTVKLWPYLYHHPTDLKFLPAIFLFAYGHGLIRLWSFFTLFLTSWDGSRMSLASLTNAATTATTFANDARKKSSNLANMATTGGTGIANMATLFTEGARVRVSDGSSRLRKKGEGTVERLKTKPGLKRLAVRSDSSA
ncbi:MAG: hypothetical protein L6R38_006496 [Xanthoria sp. 2 TBL-2021]|nr:MAG: hypothetical protein L6R38_006496 [Xanthoria sp. 2 TBL-2021]